MYAHISTYSNLRLSMDSKSRWFFNQLLRSAQAWASLDLADAKLGQGLMKAAGRLV